MVRGPEQEQRAYIKIETLRGKKAEDIHIALIKVCQDHALAGRRKRGERFGKRSESINDNDYQAILEG